MQETPSILSALRLLGLDADRLPALDELTATEAAWLSGYFAGLARARSANTPAVEHRSELQPVAATKSSSAEQLRVRVLYGTETGNAAGLAKQLAERIRNVVPEVDVVDLANYKPRALEREHTIVIITSTHGDGTPPEPAARFFEQLEGAAAPKSLAKLRYAVLGLGDSSYEHFCRAAKVVDERLAELGARRLVPRLECDLDFEAPATRWIDELLPQLGERKSVPTSMESELQISSTGQPARAVFMPASHDDDEQSYDKHRPFAATVLETFALTGRGSSKETRHLSLSLEGSQLQFSPGDALGVCAPNDPALALQLARALGASGDELVTVEGQRVPLAKALMESLDLNVATPTFLRAWAQATNSKELGALVQPGAEAALKFFLRSRHVIDLVTEYPATSFDLDSVVRALRRLTPRLYSIASSLAATPDEAHLTVSVVRYQRQGRSISGVASGYMADRVFEGHTLPVYVHANPNFRLPADPNAKLLMIGAGTGIAPYRAFLQERAATHARGESWLFFGERNFRTDFLYQAEWQAWLRDRTLSRLTLAFSRDQTDKIYVQQRLRENAREIYDWLQQGAHVYVCGDAVGLAPAVHDALLSIVEQQTASRERATEYLHQLRDERRYQRDVY
jgi:sulfite reductase (NADPH) flavoprotein alpha-component